VRCHLLLRLVDVYPHLAFAAIPAVMERPLEAYVEAVADVGVPSPFLTLLNEPVPITTEKSLPPSSRLMLRVAAARPSTTRWDKQVCSLSSS